MSGTRIVIYSPCYNEEKILPYYLRHYEQFAEKIIIFDNESTDRSPEIINAHPLCERRVFKTGGKLRDDLHLNLIQNNGWKEQRGTGVDWVMCVDMDEFVWTPDLIKRLEEAKSTNVGIIQPRGWQMLSRSFDFTYQGQIYDAIKTGYESFWYYKATILNPNLIEETGHTIGCHLSYPKLRGFPRTRIWYSDESKIEMLHFKRINQQYFQERTQRIVDRYSDENRALGWTPFPGDPSDQGIEEEYSDGEVLVCNVFENLNQKPKFAHTMRFTIQNISISNRPGGAVFQASR